MLFNRKDDLAVTGLVDQAMATMTGYGWAGKVRSLAKVLREAMLLREEGWVELDDLRIATSAGRGPFASRRTSGTVGAGYPGAVARTRSA